MLQDDECVTFAFALLPVDEINICFNKNAWVVVVSICCANVTEKYTR